MKFNLENTASNTHSSETQEVLNIFGALQKRKSELENLLDRDPENVLLSEELDKVMSQLVQIILDNPTLFPEITDDKENQIAA